MINSELRSRSVSVGETPNSKLPEVVVTGIGLLSSLGSTQESWHSLLAQQSRIQPRQPFPELSPYPLGLMGQKIISLDFLTQSVVSAALQDAKLTPPLPRCGIVIGSSRGCQGAWEELIQSFAQTGTVNQNFLKILPHQAAIIAAQKIASQGTVLSPMAACATGIWSLARGFELIKTGQYEQVLAGAVEAPITPLSLAGFRKMGALAKTGCYPFDQHREGLVLGEGGAILVLESGEQAKHRGVEVYGKLLGFGLNTDAYHVSAPNPNHKMAIAAIQQCLDRSHLRTTDIDYIHVHGTSTQLNDANEAQLITQLFPQGVPVSSTKGATGHTLGASGAIGAAFCCLALKYQTLPPCVGLKTPAFDLDFVRTPRQTAVKQVLNFSFGFGGQNAIMALGSSNPKSDW